MTTDNSPSERRYDLVVFGATGFTGKLVAEYLAASSETFSWAIAGRSADKLADVKSELDLGDDVGLIAADSADRASLAAMAADTRVVLTTVGPYQKFGAPLVAACVEAETDYVDITGEPEFVNGVIERHDEVAQDRRLRIVNCCGFDSIPHDLGAYMVAQALPDDASVTIQGFVSASGKISGGTWQSAVNAMGRARQQLRGPRRPASDGRKVRGLKTRAHYEKAVKGWVAPMPTIDPQIVLRSARALATYGREFRYGHYVRVGSLPRLMGLGVGVGSVFALAQLPPTRKMLLKMRQSGAGPTPEERARSKFRVTFVGRAGDQRVLGEASGGDPGYGETSKMVAESALCLALDRDQLPEHFGVITPAVAMGDRLLERLRAAGMRFEILSQSA
ncbi:MAG: saccharopine dehydrogenase NADP-binding domain-containing protein [Acidobacteriota bacterium]